MLTLKNFAAGFIVLVGSCHGDNLTVEICKKLLHVTIVGLQSLVSRCGGQFFTNDHFSIRDIILPL